MDNLREKSRAWYGPGLAFECTGCGQCCAGPEEGFVWVTRQEIDAISAFLKIPSDEFVRRYVRRLWGRQSLVMRPDNMDCPFLAEPDAQGHRGCLIYDVRPTQCRTWPFWPMNIADMDAWSWVAGKCPGINRGKLHPADEIERKAQATRE